MAMGMLLVSHVPAIASGLETLIKQVAKDVPITTAVPVMVKSERIWTIFKKQSTTIRLPSCSSFTTSAVPK